MTTVARVVREVVERLLPSIPNLRSLNVGKCYKLTSADVGSIEPVRQLLHFDDVYAAFGIHPHVVRACRACRACVVCRVCVCVCVCVCGGG